MSESAQTQDSHAQLQVPLDFIQSLRRMAAELGGNPAMLQALEALPAATRFAPTVDIGQPIRMLALDLGRLVAHQESADGQLIFLRAGEVVTLDSKTGDVEQMRPGRFAGWIEQFCAFRCSGKSSRLRDGLSREDAALILEQDSFKQSLRELRAVHKLRLPVLRPGPPATVEFLPPGYDAATGIYTCDLLGYSLDWTVQQALEWFCDVFDQFPWNGREETDDLLANRSFAVHVALTLGNFCHAMFAPGTLRPIGAYFANKPGSGKTRLAEATLAHVHGFVSTTSAPKDDEKMDVKLETVARARRSYVIFDDIGGGLRSHSLNKFITSARHSGRCYNSNSEFFDEPQVTQVVVTGNELDTSEDVQRRALIAELFLSEEVRGRTFRRTVSPEWLASEETRASFCAACAAIVRWWATGDGRESGTRWSSPMPQHPQPLETFEHWTGVIGGMVLLAGFADPLARPEMDVGGATTEDEIKTLLVRIAESKTEDCILTRKELVEAAREYGLIERMVGTLGDPEPEQDQLKRLGRQLQRWRGQHLRTTDGRKFRFSKKKQKSGATYPLEFLRD